MNKVYKSLSLILFVLLGFACSDDDPLPVPIVDFFLDPGVAEVGVPVMFDNYTTNADNYEWDFGDGQVFTDISPTITFASPGDVTVTLRAYTQDNQVDSVSKTFRVHERVATGYILSVFPPFDVAGPWDPDEQGIDQLPDLVMQMAPDDPNNQSGFVDGIYTNRANGPISAGIDPMVLSDEDWSFIVFDFDGDIDDVQPEDLTYMIGAQFNPLQAATFKNDQEDAGFISVFLQDSNGAVLDVDVTFELQ